MITATFRSARLPLLSYYVVTVVIPIANGAGSTRPSFLEHVAFVLLAPLVFIVLFTLFRYAWRKVMAGFDASERALHRVTKRRRMDGHPSV